MAGKKTARTSDKNKKSPLSHRIFGSILLFFGAFFVFVFIVSASIQYESSIWVMLVCGIVFCVIGILLLTGTIYKAEKKRRTKGVYLTEDAIDKLEKGIELPIIYTPLFLDYGEVAVYYSEATLLETKKRVVGRTGGYSGVSVRIAKGLSVRTGGSSGRSVYGDVSFTYPGELVITNQRIVFLSDSKGFELKHHSIIAATAHKDGFVFQGKSKSYVLLLPRVDLATLAFDGVRTGSIPIGGVVTST